jgi:uncharacterized membrane protein YccC
MRYFATKSRLKMRTLGTILGVVLGIPLLYFVPSIEGQLLLTIIFGVLFLSQFQEICHGDPDGNTHGTADF